MFLLIESSGETAGTMTTAQTDVQSVEMVRVHKPGPRRHVPGLGLACPGARPVELAAAGVV